MIEKTVEKLFIDSGLGSVRFPISPVSGGFLHRMFRVDTEKGSFALKQLDPKIMSRPGALENFRTAERLESVLEEAEIPIVPALTIGGHKMQECGGEFFYIFRWQNGSITDQSSISLEQCRIAGSIQGSIHAIAPAEAANGDPEAIAVDWDGYIEKASKQGSELEALLRENKDLLLHAQSELNTAHAGLPAVECIVNEDMDPKNVMWDGGEPFVIDLECLARGNPVISAVRLSLQWAGADTCELDFDKLRAFFAGYFNAYDNGFRDYRSVFGLAYAWIEWLEYNIQRTLEKNSDAAECEAGLAEARNAIARIRYLRNTEEAIKRWLELLFENGGLVKTEPNSPKIVRDNESGMSAQDIFELAMRHIYGDGVPEDNVFDFELLTRAHEMGHIEASYNLGICFHYGYGTDIDLKKAFELYFHAANAKHGKGMELVGRFYNQGIHVQRDRRLAELWLNRAIESGDDEAAEEARKELNRR